MDQRLEDATQSVKLSSSTVERLIVAIEKLTEVLQRTEATMYPCAYQRHPPRVDPSNSQIKSEAKGRRLK